jgi:hypothetical protein
VVTIGSGFGGFFTAHHLRKGGLERDTPPPKQHFELSGSTLYGSGSGFVKLMGEIDRGEGRSGSGGWTIAR